MSSTHSRRKKSRGLLRLENVTFACALLGIAMGLAAPELSKNISFLGDIFLTLLRMTIIPLIFVSVFLAVAKQAGQGHLSNLGLKTFLYFLTTSSLACITGLLATNLLPDASQVTTVYEGYDAAKLNSVSYSQILLGFFSGNIFKSLANGEIIQIVIFSIIMGVASVKIASEKREFLVRFSDATHDLIMTVIQAILYLAPIGILALVASLIATTDLKSFSGLGWFFIATGCAALTHALITLPAIGFFIGRFNPYKFIFNVKEALLVALASASSSATLPVSTRVLEDQENVSPKITGFVLPLGATLNMDGSALYQAIVVIFLGKVAGIDFALSQQITIFLFVLLSSSGTAGIPGGGIIMMGAMLQLVGVPLELIGLYLLIDRFWDPLITAVNVMGDLFGTKTIDQLDKRNSTRAPILEYARNSSP